LLVPVGEPEALASAIRRLAEDEELRVRLGAQGREVFAARASRGVLGSRWRDLLAGLM
jgi:glycosyltransferase involved in cell wall biosynthesis